MGSPSATWSWLPAASRILGEPLYFEPRHDSPDQIHDRRFFVTKSGYVGLAPENTQIGDIKCIFLGAPVPYVLRQHPKYERFELVGPCYLHGAMSAEVRHIHASHRLAKDPRHPMEDFYIF